MTEAASQAKLFKKEITLKFDGSMPEAEPLPDKKVLVKLTDESGTVFSAILNAKSLRKAAATAAELEHWIGAISGQLQKGADGWEIAIAGIQVFEQKIKPPKDEIQEVAQA
jgi:hypothetical protein